MVDRRILVTPRCELRPVTADDAAELHALWITPGVRRFLWDDTIIPLERAVATVAASDALFTQHRFGLWVARPKGSDELCGFAGLWPFRDEHDFELLYGVAEPLWGQGYAVEIARAILHYCETTLDMPAVRASIDAPNAASARVLDKLGFVVARRAVVDGLDLIFYERARG